MTKTYIYRVLSKDQYKVIRVDNNKKPGDKGRMEEYLIDLRGGDMLCSCKSFYYRKRVCKHIAFVLAQLRDGGGILEFENDKDYDKLLGELK